MGISAWQSLVTPTGGTQAIALADLVAGILPGYINGLTIANNGTDATNDIDFATGSCGDSTGKALISLATAMTKQLDVAWAAGTAAGGRMSAAAITDTTYHCFLILNPVTGAVDCGFDTSPTAPTLPTGYTLFRRIGSIIRSGGLILPFLQSTVNPDEFTLVTSVVSVNTPNPGTSAVLAAMTVPLGIKVKAKVLALLSSTTVSTIFTLGLKSAGEASGGAKEVYVNTAFASQSRAVLNIETDTSGRINYILGATSDATTTVTIHTYGWTDGRGR